MAVDRVLKEQPGSGEKVSEFSVAAGDVHAEKSALVRKRSIEVFNRHLDTSFVAANIREKCADRVRRRHAFKSWSSALSVDLL